MRLVHIIHPKRTNNGRWFFSDKEREVEHGKIESGLDMLLNFQIGSRHPENVSLAIMFADREFPKAQYEIIKDDSREFAYYYHARSEGQKYKHYLFFGEWIWNWYPEKLPEKIFLRIVVLEDD